MMMKAKKHVFRCERCGAECMIYKKGKNHRVLVCPTCGVLATNGLLKKIGGFLGSVPHPGIQITKAAGSLLSGEEERPASPQPTHRHRSSPLKSLYYVDKALGGR